ncbi:hypothetical protein BDZ94DRAFT_391956 [Collybia nuda]|uniref:Uncharacterized protein n=1 Tax=Collybia nuda TaxID=64659 RepID=A0A9P5YAW2_9AGAR|nr:hypothetical protein BDZ94DRAFT_391956 [Collybia nuda]
MKCYAILTIFFFLASLGAAAPVDKGKGKAVDPPSTPPSRPTTPPPPNTPPSQPNTPTPGRDRNVHLPGRSGTHTDGRGISTLRYGDDDLPEHMGHLQRNQAQFPHNRNPMSLAPENGNRNRADALRGIPTGGTHPVSGVPRVRDEKMPNMLNNPKHSTSTTVEYLPEHESRKYKEGGYTSQFKEAIKKGGPNAKGQLRPNPGWLPPHPGQQRGHEAPARLNSQTFRPNAGSSSTPGPSKDKQKQNKAMPPPPPPGEGYTPQGRPGLRHREGKAAPPPPPPKREKSAAGPSGQTNLRPGRVVPAGHVWKPTDGQNSPSHAGAPPPLSGTEQRHPPRPQNHDQYMKQKEEKQKQTRPTSPAPPTDPKHAANLAKFEKAFGPAKKGNGGGKANEAPARIQTHTNNAPAHPASRPASPAPHNPPSRPPSPASRPSTPPPHGSGSKDKKPAKKG